MQESKWSYVVVLGGWCIAAGMSQVPPCTEKAFPSSIQPQSGCQPEKSTGMWYRYRMVEPGKNIILNERANVTGIGPTTTPLTSDPAHAYWVSTAYTNQEDNKCHVEYYMGMYSNNGKKVGYGLSPDDDFVIHPENVAVFYTDNTKFMVEYGCLKKNSQNPKLCDAPLIHAESRIRPDQMSDEDQEAYDKILNDLFAPYCVTVDDIPKQAYDAEKPFCDFVPPPDCATRMINGLGEIVVTATSTAKAKNKLALQADRNTCKWPLVIPGEKRHEPTKLVGQWYLYRKLYPSEPSSINQRYNVHNIGAGELPLSDIPAQWQWIEYSQYDAPDENTCRTGFWTGAVGSGGQQIGFGVSTQGPQMPVLNNMNGLYYDNAKFSLDYGCIVPNTKTNTCDSPYVYASVRTHPNKLTQADKDGFDKIINSFLNKYGCSASDVPKPKYVDAKPFCNYTGPNDCIAKAIKGLTQATQNA
ncbi:uncharacterized protein LOC129599889 [Paramacrobiotus metropolitanus]|uniref:uncharacterized protein LOC129599889 n=1 Tax=Paramacrobiotus metropolitanus TaxID=2943436 RepID=UPI002445F813|nr:uncharacterized protein LOC129599889 [Paramacrobiotus metropolitanus]